MRVGNDFLRMKNIGVADSKQYLKKMIDRHGDMTLQELFTLANPVYEWAMGIIEVFGRDSLASEVLDGFEDILAFREAVSDG